MKLVSFYADVDGTDFYSRAADNLKDQCEALGVDHHIVSRDYGGSWLDNVRAKPTFLLEMVEELREPFLWLDVDCRILRPLDFTVSTDWGVYLRQPGVPHDFVHYVSPPAENFLRLWIETIEEQGRGSHTAFISLYQRGSVSTSTLPSGYFELVEARGIKSKRDYFTGKSN